MNGEINLNIPPICILCGGKNFEDSIKLNNINFFRDKRYIRIPLCEKHFEREMKFRKRWFRLMPLILPGSYSFIYLFFTVFFKVIHGSIDLLFPTLDIISRLISVFTLLILICRKLYILSFGLNSFIELRVSRITLLLKIIDGPSNSRI